MPQDIISFVLPAVLIGLIGLVVGAVVGYLLAGLQEPGPTEPQRPKNLAEAARLWRNKRSGTWVVEIDGQLIQDPSNLTSQQRDILQKSQAELRHWVGADEPVVQTAPIPPAAVAAPPPPPPAAGVPPAVAAAPMISRLSSPSSRPPLPPISQPTVEPVSTDLPTIIAKPLFGDKTKDKDKAVVSKSIAGQVDDIVQEHLPVSPFRDRVIRVQDSPQMGIQVVIDDQVFEGVGDVPYPDIQQFLRSCVAEWERRSVK